jgi:hypothetical protein
LSVGRKIEDEREALRCLRAMERGGLSPGEWGRAHGVDGRSLRAWQMNIGRRSAPAPARPRKPRAKPRASGRTLVELVATGAPVAAQTSASRYVLEVGGARFEFGDDVSVTTLRRVLEALRAC